MMFIEQEIPSPGKDIISNIDASVKRVKSAVINRMVETSQKRNNTGQYFGWLLKARLVLNFDDFNSAGT